MHPPVLELDIFLRGLSQLAPEVVPFTLQAPVLLQRGPFLRRRPLQLQLRFKAELLCLRQ